MWNYSDKVMDHFRHPRNIGEVENPDGTGQVGSLACGDALRLTFKLGPDKRIAEARFKTFGCASAIASSSVLTEMIKGMTVEEAERVTNKDIAMALGGLPDQKMHCSVMGREALEAAIYNYRTGKTGTRELEDRVVCTCFGVTESELHRVIRENNLRDIESVTNYCKAGGGCGKCRPEIERMLEEATREKREDGEAGPAVKPPLTNLKRIKLVQEVLENDIRPALKRDGGDVDLIDIEGTRVIISFRGKCAGCQASELTRRDFIQATLREAVSQDIEVEEIPA